MKEFKGTKGPWDFKDVGICRQDKAGLQLGFIMTADKSRVNECAANAHLIVSAPDLLKELQKLRAYVIDVCGVTEEDCHAEHPLMSSKSAIAKALGETK